VYTRQVSYSDTAPLRQVSSNQVIQRIGSVVFVGSELIVGLDSAPLRLELTDTSVSGIITASTDIGGDSEVISVTASALTGTFTGTLRTSPFILGPVQMNNGVLEVCRIHVVLLFRGV
jgi:hypothetical protein